MAFENWPLTGLVFRGVRISGKSNLNPHSTAKFFKLSSKFKVFSNYSFLQCVYILQVLKVAFWEFVRTQGTHNSSFCPKEKAVKYKKGLKQLLKTRD